MHFDNFAWIGDVISCDSLQISWGQCPRAPGKKNTLEATPGQQSDADWSDNGDGDEDNNDGDDDNSDGDDDNSDGDDDNSDIDDDASVTEPEENSDDDTHSAAGPESLGSNVDDSDKESQDEDITADDEENNSDLSNDNEDLLNKDDNPVVLPNIGARIRFRDPETNIIQKATITKMHRTKQYQWPGWRNVFIDGDKRQSSVNLDIVNCDSPLCNV
jgi:hypothetical protein